MSRLHGWKPKPKFTAGLNVPRETWERIFKDAKTKATRVTRRKGKATYHYDSVTQA